MAHIYNSQLDAYSLYHKSQESHSTGIGPALPALGHAIAGSTGSAISNLCIYPLDLIITRLQVQRSLRTSSAIPDAGEYRGVIDAFEKIYNNEGGIPAFYAGVLQDTGKSIADSFLFFLFYNYLRSNRLKKNGTSSTTLPALDEMVVGALAGACSKFFTTPISNIVTRKQTSLLISSRSSKPTNEPSVQEIIESIRIEKGLQGFWSGYSASLVLTLNPSLTFFLYEFFKRSFLPRDKRENPGAGITFLMAAVSKAIASSITYPFSLAKSRAQTSSSSPVDLNSASELKNQAKDIDNKREAKAVDKNARAFAKRSTIFNTVLEIYRKEGAAGLYEGVWGEILKGFFSHGITMIVKESIHKLIIQAYFVILKAVNKFPSPSELAKDAQHAINEGTERAGVVVRDGYEKLGEAYENGKAVMGNAAERASVIGNNATEAAKTAAGETAKQIGSTSGTANQSFEKAADDLKSKEAGHLLGNAQEMLGGKIKGSRDAGMGEEDLKRKNAGHLMGNAQAMLGDTDKISRKDSNGSKE